MTVQSFSTCAVCGSPIVFLPGGLAYCPICDPQPDDKCAAAPCPICDGTGDRPQMAGQSCPICAGSGASPYLPPPAAIREHWGYLMGIQDHGLGLARDDSPFFRRSDADRAWRLGWARTDRDAATESRREKSEAEYLQEAIHG